MVGDGWRSSTRSSSRIAVVYTANHYVIDLLIGGVYATVRRVRRAPAVAAAGAGPSERHAVAATAAPEPDRPPAGRAGAAGSLRYPLTVFAVSRLAVYGLIAAAGWTARVPRQSGVSYHALFAPLGQWDAVWYRWIAEHGYDPADRPRQRGRVLSPLPAHVAGRPSCPGR